MLIKISIILIIMSRTSNGYRQFNGKGWFTDQANGPRKAQKYETSFARIVDPYFGLGGYNSASLGLHMGLSTVEYGNSNRWYMCNLQDIRKFLQQMNVTRAEELRDRVIEVYRPDPLRITGIGINKNLLSEPRR